MTRFQRAPKPDPNATRYVLYAVPPGDAPWVEIGEARPFKTGPGFMLDFRMIPENAKIALKPVRPAAAPASPMEIFSFADQLEGRAPATRPLQPKPPANGQRS